jgi:hypothetical protein
MSSLFPRARQVWLAILSGLRPIAIESRPIKRNRKIAGLTPLEESQIAGLTVFLAFAVLRLRRQGTLKLAV